MHSTPSFHPPMSLTPVGTNTSTFHDLDGLLSPPQPQELEGWCDFSTAFEESASLDSDATNLRRPSPTHRTQDATVVAKVNARSHKRKNMDSIVSEKTQDEEGEIVEGESSHIGRWTKKEHELFLQGLLLHGKSWKKISSLVVTRTLVQIRTHAQKYLQKQSKTALKAAATAAALASASGPSSDTAVKSIKGRQIKSTRKTISIDPQAAVHVPDASTFHAIAFPSLFTPQSSSSSTVIPTPSPLLSGTTTYLEEPPRTRMSPLDALLHDTEPPLPVQVIPSYHQSYHPLRQPHLQNLSSEYNSLSTSTDEDLRQWLQHRHLPLNSPLHIALKRRREVNSSSSSSSSTTSHWPMVNPMQVSMFSHHYPSLYDTNGHEPYFTTSTYPSVW